MGWSESEIRATVREYFKLLQAEQAGQPTNKVAIYRGLSRRFPRSAKAFELKFQNISAVLYELRHPYCSGLRPRPNYQRLLRLLVIDHLNRTPIPHREPHQILFAKLRELCRRRRIAVRARGAGRHGLAIEDALQIPVNSHKAPDFMGIEIKTKHDKSLQTLFSRTPTQYIGVLNRDAFFRKHARIDRATGRRCLYTSFSSTPDSWGFRVCQRDNRLVVTRNDVAVLSFDITVIDDALLSKHSQTVYLTLKSIQQNGRTYCTIESASYCRGPSTLRFLRLLAQGKVFLDFTMSETNRGKVKDHGFLWRVESGALASLYVQHEAIDLL